MITVIVKLPKQCRHLKKLNAGVPTLLPCVKRSDHGGVERLAVLLDLATSILQHVTQVGMHVLTHILDRRLNCSIHQCDEVLLRHTSTSNPQCTVT